MAAAVPYTTASVELDTLHGSSDPDGLVSAPPAIFGTRRAARMDVALIVAPVRNAFESSPGLD